MTSRTNKRARPAHARVLLAASALPLVLLACNAIIGTEDRFFEADAGGGSTNGSDGSTDATVDERAASDASNEGGDSSDEFGDAGDATTTDATGSSDGSTTSKDGGPGDAAPYSAPVTLVTFATTTPPAVSLDTDATHLYIGFANGVYAVDKATPTSMPPPFWPGGGNLTLLQLQVFDTMLYMLMTNSAQGGLASLYTCPLASLTTSSCAPVQLRAMNQAIGFTIDDSANVYWYTGGSGGHAAAGPLVDGGGETGELAFPYGRSIAYNNASELFVGGAGGIARVTTDPFGSAMTINAAAPVTSIALDTMSVYGASTDAGIILEMTSGFASSTVPSTLVSNQTSPTALAIDGDAGLLFWLNADAGAGHATLASCSTQDGDAAVLQDGLSTPSLLVAKPDALYFQDIAPVKRPAIVRIARGVQ